jgi:ParB family chromosome partitioning protein
MIGLETVPVVIRDYPGDDAMEEMAIIENIHREDLNPIEEALSYQRMVDRVGAIHAAAHRLGLRPAKLYQRLPWLELEPEIQELVASSRLHSDPRDAEAAARRRRRSFRASCMI